MNSMTMKSLTTKSLAHRFLTLTFLFLLLPTVAPMVASAASASCEHYMSHLAKCTPFSCKIKHPLTDELMEKKIVGLTKDKKCKIIDEMPSNSKMICHLDKEKRMAYIEHTKAAAKAESVTVSGESRTVARVQSEKSANGSKSSSASKTHHKVTHKLDGKEVKNPMQEALADGSCKMSW